MMLEYKVLTIMPTKSGKYAFRDFFRSMSSVNTELMEKLLNEYAKEGWRVISITQSNTSWGGLACGERLIVTLERKLDNLAN